MLMGLVFYYARLLTGREFKGSKAPRIQSADGRIKGRLLRKEGRHRATVAAGTAEPAGADLDLAAAEADEHRRAREVATGIRCELVAGAVGIQFLPADVPLGVNQSHASDSERTETELVADEAFACPADGTPTMAHSVLSRHDQDVTLLRLGELAEGIERPHVLAQSVRRDLTLPVVVELPGLADLFEYELDGTAVAVSRVGHLGEVLGGYGVHRRNGEPSFGARREFRQGLGEFERMARIETEDLGDCLDLVRDRLGALVLLRVRVAGTNFLVGELVGHGQLSDELRDPVLQFATALVEPLCTRIVELGLVVDGLEETDCVETFRVSAGDQCL